MEGDILNKSIEENNKIAFNNKICCTKKSYFFGYVYPKIMKEYKQYKNVYNQMSFQRFGMCIKDIERLENKTEEQKKFLYQYRKYMPLMDNNSIMNTLSKYVEDIEFDNKWSKSSKPFDWNIMMSGKYEINDQSLIKKIISTIKDFNKSQRVIASNNNYSSEIFDIDEETEYNNMYKYLFDMYEERLLKLCSNTEKLSDYVVYVYYNFFKNSSKSLLWNVFEKEIVSSIKNKSNTIVYPVYDENGKEYLGQRFSLKEVDLI